MRYSFGRSIAALPKMAKTIKRLFEPSRSRVVSWVAVLTILTIVLLGLAGPQMGTITTPSLGPLASGQEVRPATSTTEERSTEIPSSRSARPDERPLTFEESFILAAATPAQASQKETKVPASVTIAQAILESDWGRSALSRHANNYFGIKARPEPGPAGVVYMNTWEHIGGRDVTVNEPFRAYHSMEESFVDHGRFFGERPWYSAAFRFTGDAKQFAREIHKAGYATDPNYSNKLIALMDRYNLYQYDPK